MPIEVIPPGTENPSLTIKIDGRFDYSLHKEFRESYMRVSKPVSQYNIDLSEAEYLDSSALGMLLLLKEHADKTRGEVSIVSPSPMVKRVLKIANFDQFFTID